MNMLNYDTAMDAVYDFYCTNQTFARHDACFGMHSHDFFEFFLVKRGTIHHQVNSRTELLKPGTLVLIRPKDEHSLTCSEESDRISFYNCNVRPELFLSCFHSLAGKNISVGELNQTVPLAPEQIQNLSERFTRIANWQNQKIPRPVEMEGRMLILEVLELFLLHQYDEGAEEPEWLRNAMEQMQDPENLRLGLPRFRELTGRSQEHVCRTMRLFYDISPREYLLQLRLQRAVRLLLYSELPVERIALSCGFENIAYFHASFLKEYHTTPLRYRRNFTENR